MGPALPDDRNLARYCRPGAFDDDGNPTYAVFLLRAATAQKPREEYLSAFVLEVLGGSNTAERLCQLRLEVAKHKVFTPAKTGKYALLNVGEARQAVHDWTANQRWIPITLEVPPYFHAGMHDTAIEEETAAKALLDAVKTFHST